MPAETPGLTFEETELLRECTQREHAIGTYDGRKVVKADGEGKRTIVVARNEATADLGSWTGVGRGT